jgi:hypothetical protein
VGGDIVASFDTTGFHEVELDFRDPPDDNPDPDEPGELEIHLELTFSPLGKSVEVVRDGTVYLRAQMPGDPANPGVVLPKSAAKASRDLGKSKEDRLQTQLLGTGVLPGARGKVTYGQNDTIELEVEIEDVPDAVYAVWIDDGLRGELEVVDGHGSLELESEAGDGATGLGFVVKGSVIDVRLGEDTVLATTFPGSVPEALGKFKQERRSETKLRLNLHNTREDLDARGLVGWVAKSNGREVLKIGVLDLPPGEYTVLVDGQDRGSFTVPVKGKAKVTYDTQATPGGPKLLLDFTVMGTLLEIADAKAVVQLAAQLE